MNTEMRQKQVERQLEIERLYNSNQLMPRLRAEFAKCDKPNFLEIMKLKGIPQDFGLDAMAQICLHKRADMATMVGVLWHHLKDSQATANMLLKCAEADLLEWNVQLSIFIVMANITQDVQDELDRYQFPMPMVIEPRELLSNTDTGYIDIQESVVLNSRHDDDVCLDHLNRLNKIKFVVNTDVVKFVKNEWRNLDRPKDGESFAEYQERKRAFKKYDKTAKDVISLITDEADHFYLTHRYDFRGRTYDQGYHIHYQGNDWNKACIEFADKEMVHG